MDDVIGKHLVMLAVVRMDCRIHSPTPRFQA